MIELFRVTRVAAALMAAVLTLGSATSPSYADTGTVRMRITKAGFVLGVGGGTGILHFKGHNYRLRIDGISAGTIGVATADAAGIAGAYSAISSGVAFAGGAKAARLQNAKGVVLDLRGAQVGFEVSLSLSGASISLQ